MLLTALPLYSAASQSDTSQPSAPGSPVNMLPDGPGKDLVLKDCQSCHSIQNVVSRHGTADDWAQVVSQMIGRGANISDDDADTIVDYLAAHFGPSSPQAGQSASSADNSQPASPAASPAASANKNGGSVTPVDVNKATADLLQSGLGMTQDQAETIVQYRKQNGDFKTLQQLLSVLGESMRPSSRVSRARLNFEEFSIVHHADRIHESR